MNWFSRHKKTFLSILLFVLLQVSFLAFYMPKAQAFSQSDVLWETGAEAGTIPAPFDEAKYGGRSYIEIESSTPVHGATKSYRFFQPDSPVIREEEQVRLFKFSASSYPKEFYQSCWVYFPSTGSGSNWDISDTTVTALFGWQIRMGKEGNSPTSEWTGGRFRADKTDPREIEFSYVWDGFIVDRWSDEQKSGLYIENYLDQWIQLQLYVKITEGTDSVVRAWVYNPNFNGGVKKEIFDRSGGDWTGTFDCASPEGYSWWDTHSYRYSSRSINGIPNLRCQVYTSRSDCNAKMAYFDDVVWATAEVPTTYTVGGVTPGFEDFEDGFETGDLTKWNGTTYGGGGVEPAVTSTYSYKGTYSAKLTTDGTLYAYAALIRTVQNTSEVYQRSWVRFEDLPDSGSAINFFRTWNTGGTYISNAGIYRNATGTYWKVKVKDDTPETTYVLDNTIAADTWYYVEFYTNVTANGNATLWAISEASAKITKTGDYSALGTLAQVNPCHVTGLGAGSETSVYHDNFRCDNVRIKGGTPKIFHTSFMTLVVFEENETEYIEPLSSVTINGTVTDELGYYEWTNLDYDTQYEFHIDPPSGYYPGWITNYNGYFSWNGSLFILFHTITEVETGYIHIYFHVESLPYVKEVPSTTTLVAVDMEKNTLMGDEFSFQVSGSSWIAIHSAGYDEDPFLCAGSTATAKSYNAATGVCNITVASATTLVLLYDRPTPSHWGIWFAGGLASGVMALLLGLWNRTKEIVRKWRWPILLFLITITSTGVVLWLTE